MIPAEFDPLWAALGIKRKDWLKSLVKPTPVTMPRRIDAATTRGGSAC